MNVFKKRMTETMCYAVCIATQTTALLFQQDAYSVTHDTNMVCY